MVKLRCGNGKFHPVPREIARAIAGLIEAAAILPDEKATVEVQLHRATLGDEDLPFPKTCAHCRDEERAVMEALGLLKEGGHG